MKKVGLIILLIVAVACGNENYEMELLTDGIWSSVPSHLSPSHKTVVFENDGTYFMEEIIQMLSYLPIENTTAKITGDWVKEGDELIFSNTKIEIPVDSSNISMVASDSGIAIGSWYSIMAKGIYQSDSIVYWTSDNPNLNDSINNRLNLDSILVPTNGNQGNQKISWKILKLTADSLVVKDQLLTTKFIKKK